MAAARTPAAGPMRVGLGDATLVRATFTTVVTGDTWVSGISANNYIDHWTSMTSNQSTQASAGSNASFSAGTFTFKPGEDSLNMTLYVLMKG